MLALEMTQHDASDLPRFRQSVSTETRKHTDLVGDVSDVRAAARRRNAVDETAVCRTRTAELTRLEETDDEFPWKQET